MRYDYKCMNCSKVFETEMNINVVHLGMMTTCTECGCTAQHERHYEAPIPIIKKGTGWTPKSR